MQVHFSPFRLGMKIFYWGILFKMPFGKYHVVGKEIK